MARASAMQEVICIHDLRIPVRIHRERRLNRRVSLGKNVVHLRVPIFSRVADHRAYMQWVENWLMQLYQDRPKVLERFRSKRYESGDTISIQDRQYQLSIRQDNRKTGSAQLNDSVISIKLPEDIRYDEQQKMAQKLIRRIIAKDHLTEVTKRVYELNDKHYQKKIKSVKLKYNVSNWGSCSSNGNINISTRLLLAPREVRDYVYIHELAHLTELNHSPRFWSLVRAADPKYKVKELWLKTHGADCQI